MSVVGAPTDWAGLIDPMVPEILNLVVQSWEEMPAPAPDQREDDITVALCRALKNNRTARNLMFQIDTQVVELDPAPGQDFGRLDISFRPLIPREDIYFCLEAKRAMSRAQLKFKKRKAAPRPSGRMGVQSTLK